RGAGHPESGARQHLAGAGFDQPHHHPAKPADVVQRHHAHAGLGAVRDDPDPVADQAAVPWRWRRQAGLNPEPVETASPTTAAKLQGGHRPPGSMRNAWRFLSDSARPTRSYKKRDQANGSRSTMVSSRSAPVATRASAQPDSSSMARR